MKKKFKNNKKRLPKYLAFGLCLAIIFVSLSAIAILALNNWDFQQAYDKIVDNTGNEYPSYIVKSHDKTNPSIKEDEASLDEMKMATKEWFEYVDYEYYKDVVGDKDDTYIYKIYTPVDYSSSSVMAIRDYNPNEISGSNTVFDCFWKDMAVMFTNIAVANASVVASGGIVSGIAGALGQEAVALGATALIRTDTDILTLAPYYASPEFMGISGTDWKGISNSGFYNANSITISMGASETLNVAKTNSVDSTYTVGGSSKLKTEIKIPFLSKIEGEMSSSASSALKYGVNYQQGQSINNSVNVSRTFSARTDDEVKNVAWKLVEYVVRVPYKIEVYGKDEPNNLVATTYVTNDLLHGVCRVFANGYIEHWNTGELVNYAQFFEGFITETELVNRSKKLLGGE